MSGAEVFSTRSVLRVTDEGRIATTQQEVGTEQLPSNSLKIDMTLSKYRFYSMAEIQWEWDLDLGDSINPGSSPWDYINLKWSNNHYVFNDWYNSSDNLERDRRGPSIAVWRYDDSVVDTIGGPYTGYAGCFLRQETTDRRTVYGTYVHTWDDVTFGGFSSGAPPSLIFGNEEKVWRSFDQISRA